MSDLLPSHIDGASTSTLTHQSFAEHPPRPKPPIETQNAPLFRLPREIRDQIYLEVMGKGDDDFISDTGGQVRHELLVTDPLCAPRETNLAAWAPPPLARTSRQLRNEVLTLFRKKHDFVVRMPEIRTIILKMALDRLHVSQPEARLPNLTIALEEPTWLALGRLGLVEEISNIVDLFGYHLPEDIQFTEGWRGQSLEQTQPRRYEWWKGVLRAIRSGNNLELFRLADLTI
jgi:hypothetical protein